MLNINEHGIQKIRKNVLSITNTVIQNMINSHHKNNIGPKKMSSFHQIPLLQSYVKILYQISVLTPLQMCLKKLVVQSEKLTLICEMEELCEVENVNLLRVHGITRKARSNSFDPVKELRGPILAPGCSNVCSVCVEFLEKEK